MKYKVLVPTKTTTGVEVYNIKYVDDCFIDIDKKDIHEQLECLLVTKNEEIRSKIIAILNETKSLCESKDLDNKIMEMVNEHFENLIIRL